jgi:uncharacterized membrane protein
LLQLVKKGATVKSKMTQWTANHFQRMINSIAFLPAFIAFGFLGLSYLMIHVDFSETGKNIKAEWTWLRLKDASTARAIITVIAAGIFSLTVFSFTMVMVILNQAASQMSNRVLDKLIGNRYQQVVLGFYIGTIVYSLFLMSAIRDVDSGIYVPSLSTYLLIGFAIVDIFLFIYFLHYITQSIKYSVIIRRIFRQTKDSLEKSCRLSFEPDIGMAIQGESYGAFKAGIYLGFDKEALLRITKSEELQISVLLPPGTFVLEGAKTLLVHPAQKKLTDEVKKAIDNCLWIHSDDSIPHNFYYGFRQLTEVAVRALSPGINDPGTAVESLRALTCLLSYRLEHFADQQLKDDQGILRIRTREYTFDEIFHSTIVPIWDYGKNDHTIQHELQHLLGQLLQKKSNATVSRMLLRVKQQAALRTEVK